VVSSRIRLARNLHGKAFPGWAGARERQRVFEVLSQLLMEEGQLENPVLFEIDAVSQVDRDMMREQHLISPELAEGGVGGGCVYDASTGLVAMINEEDHLRLQALRPGFDLAGAWQALKRLEAGLERHVAYAFSPSLGYLTACPSNVGTGMRASVMLHLPGLKLMDEVDQVVRGLARMGFAVRGAFGEGSEASGSLFQISNQATLGISEDGTLQRIAGIVQTLVTLENHARQRLRELPMPRLLDHVGRVFGVFSHAAMLSAGEAMDILSGLMLGIESGMITGADCGSLENMMWIVQPGHLQREARRSLSALERDVFRAGYLRGVLSNIKRTGQ
jgi:protein arginine kinase